MVGVVTGKVATGKFLFECGSQLLEGRRVFHVLIADTSQFYHLLWNWSSRIDKEVLSNLRAVWTDLNI